MRLSDTIESFIKAMLDSEEQSGVDLKRNELAEYFGCAPSQINYVLSTRFTPDHGYMTESHRGGGGYIRIVRLHESPSHQILRICNDRIGDSIDYTQAIRLISALLQQGTLSPEEAGVMRAAISAEALSVPLPENVKNVLRAKMLRTMLLDSLRRNADGI